MYLSRQGVILRATTQLRSVGVFTLGLCQSREILVSIAAISLRANDLSLPAWGRCSVITQYLSGGLAGEDSCRRSPRSGQSATGIRSWGVDEEMEACKVASRAGGGGAVAFHVRREKSSIPGCSHCG